MVVIAYLFAFDDRADQTIASTVAEAVDLPAPSVCMSIANVSGPPLLDHHMWICCCNQENSGRMRR